MSTSDRSSLPSSHGLFLSQVFHCSQLVYLIRWISKWSSLAQMPPSTPFWHYHQNPLSKMQSWPRPSHTQNLLLARAVPKYPSSSKQVLLHLFVFVYRFSLGCLSLILLYLKWVCLHPSIQNSSDPWNIHEDFSDSSTQPWAELIALASGLPKDFTNYILIYILRVHIWFSLRWCHLWRWRLWLMLFAFTLASTLPGAQ